jgi:hypothetical protein
MSFLPVLMDLNVPPVTVTPIHKHHHDQDTAARRVTEGDDRATDPSGDLLKNNGITTAASSSSLSPSSTTTTTPTISTDVTGLLAEWRGLVPIDPLLFQFMTQVYARDDAEIVGAFRRPALYIQEALGNTAIHRWIYILIDRLKDLHIDR